MDRARQGDFCHRPGALFHAGAIQKARRRFLLYKKGRRRHGFGLHALHERRHWTREKVHVQGERRVTHGLLQAALKRIRRTFWSETILDALNCFFCFFFKHF